MGPGRRGGPRRRGGRVDLHLLDRRRLGRWDRPAARCCPPLGVLVLGRAGARRPAGPPCRGLGGAVAPGRADGAGRRALGRPRLRGAVRAVDRGQRDLRRRPGRPRRRARARLRHGRPAGHGPGVVRHRRAHAGSPTATSSRARCTGRSSWRTARSRWPRRARTAPTAGPARWRSRGSSRRWPTSGCEPWPASRTTTELDLVLTPDGWRSRVPRSPAWLTPQSVTLAELVLHRGEVVHETYGPDTGPDTTLISWSTGKSVTHALVGIAVRDGLAGSRRAGPGARVGRATSAAPSPCGSCCNMTSGLRFVEDYVDDSISHCIDMLFGEGHTDVAALRRRTAARPPAWFRLQLLVGHHQHRQPPRRAGRRRRRGRRCGPSWRRSCSAPSA